MRKLVLKMSMSVDGFVAAAGGKIDWIFRSSDDEAIAWTVENVWQAGAHVMGSRTFRDMASYWPWSTEPFAPPMNEIPKIVFSRSGLDPAAAGSTQALADARAQSAGAPIQEKPATESWTHARVIRGDLVEEMNRLKQEPGKDLIAHGGASFAQSLARAGLIDEYRLLVHPVALGQGLALFSALAAPLALERIETRQFKGGTVAQIYRPRR